MSEAALRERELASVHLAGIEPRRRPRQASDSLVATVGRDLRSAESALDYVSGFDLKRARGDFHFRPMASHSIYRVDEFIVPEAAFDEFLEQPVTPHGFAA